MKILINRSDAFGDALLTSSMAKMIKLHFPEAHITFLVSPKAKDLFNNHPFIDEVKIYHRHLSFISKFKQILSLFSSVQPTHYFYVGGGYLPNFIAWIKWIPFRGGLVSRWHTFLFLNRGVRQKRSMVAMHEIEYNLNLLAPMGIHYHFSDRLKYVPEIVLDEVEKEKNILEFVETLKKEKMNSERPYIFIHPGMGNHSLNWSSRNYGRLILKLEQKFPNRFNFIISHTPSDYYSLQGVKDVMDRKENAILNERVYYFNGQLKGLRHLLSILSQAKLFIGPSTGMTHAAATLGVPVVALFSPIKAQSAQRWSPVTPSPQKLRVSVPDVICGEVLKCAERACPYYECMGKIEVDDIVKNAVAVLEI